VNFQVASDREAATGLENLSQHLQASLLTHKNFLLTAGTEHSLGSEYEIISFSKAPP